MSLVDELAKLEELRRSGSLTQAEFAKAKAMLLGGEPANATQRSGEQLAAQLAAQLAEVRHQNELAQIDREWEIERRQYLIIAGRDGMTYEPTAGMGIGAVGVGIFGVIWTIFAFSITSDAPDVGAFSLAKVIFPLFGVIFTLIAIYYGFQIQAKAKKYQQAFAAYKMRRADVRPEHNAGGSSDDGVSCDQFKSA